MYYFHKDEPYYSAIGASGAVSGIIYSAVIMEPNIQMLVFLFLCLVTVLQYCI